ncbi:MAG TPA: hypothetical protein EYM38_07870, partial [Dehalococcoidia bacterium]|nr:hypothetical protein [Dehalococcoidia bacterium]
MSDTGDKVLDHLPVFSDVTPESQWERLRVQGLVEQPLELDQESLLDLAQQGIAEDFHCVEGWVVPDQKWEGVPVSTLLGLARPLPEAKYLRFSSGSYNVSLSMEEVESSSVIIALRLNGEALPHEHGGPCRLIAGAKKGNFSVKWVDLIEVTATPVEGISRFIDISS